jgi:hypothetical protein
MGQEGLTIMELRFSAVSKLGSLGYYVITDGLGTCAKWKAEVLENRDLSMGRESDTKTAESEMCHIRQLSCVSSRIEACNSVRYTGRTMFHRPVTADKRLSCCCASRCFRFRLLTEI